MADKSLSDLDIFIVEDDPLISKRLSAYLTQNGAIVTSVDTIEKARTVLVESHFDFTLLDINLPDGNGLELLDEKLFPEGCGVIVMTADGGMKSAIEAMKKGAKEYLVKPFDYSELAVVFQSCRTAIQGQRIREFNHKKVVSYGDGFFFGQGLKNLHKTIDRIIESDTQITGDLPPILIEGETGTGKTSLARWIHHQGPRGAGPLIEVNCSTLTESLAESELFGYEKGAFTDAKQGQIGLFEAAQGGTLFLDEISSLSASVQSKLLIAIEDKQIRRVGSTKTIPVDIRLIGASLDNLKELVTMGRFRQDLYHRLDLLRIHIPPLRDRSEDIPELTDRLLNQLRVRYGREGVHVSELGKIQLERYNWPGNIRELKHELERALIIQTDDAISFDSLSEDIPVTVSFQSETDSWHDPTWQIPDEGIDINDVINHFINIALAQTNQNVSAAARLLNVNRDYIRYRQKSGKT